MIRRRKDEDPPPGVVDLKRYKKAREKAARQPAPKPAGPGLIGGNPRAKLILVLLAAAILVIFVLPLIQR